MTRAAHGHGPKDDSNEISARLTAVSMAHGLRFQVTHLAEQWEQDPDGCIGCFIRELSEDIEAANPVQIQQSLITALLFLSGILDDDGLAEGVL